MKLKQLTDRVWYLPHEELRDRPILGYIRGDKFSIAVDAGHSKDHTAEFYKALEEENLPLPEFTVITHWHWDHTLGMHAINGLSIANERTVSYLSDFKKKIETEGKDFFLNMYDAIWQEYKDGKPVVVTLPDIVFKGEMTIDAGNCPVRIFQTQAPHTDDSTLIEVIGEKVLFLGDSTCSSFPNGTKDKNLTDKLADAIKATEAQICLEGHWTPLSREEEIADLMGGAI